MNNQPTNKSLDDYIKDEKALAKCITEVYNDTEQAIQQITGNKERDQETVKRLFYEVIMTLFMIVNKSKTLEEVIEYKREENPEDKRYQEPMATTFREIVTPFIEKYKDQIELISQANYLNSMELSDVFNTKQTLFIANATFTKEFIKVARPYLPKEVLQSITDQ